MAMKPIVGLIFGLAAIASVAFAAAANGASATGGYYGTKIGPLSELHHGVSGDVYAVDVRTLLLKNFNYDGEGPAAYFYVGNGSRISNKGATRLRDERGQAGVIHRYRNRDVMLQLPEGLTLREVKWFAVWCDEFSVNFGDVKIPKNFQFPKPQKIDALSGVHGVASDMIVIVDAQTLLLPYFSYDGEAPDAKFWVGYGEKPTPNGIRIPDENGRVTPLQRYDKKTIVLTLPGDLTVFEIGHFGIWCEAFTVDFGHVRIPQTLNVPPSLRMLGISPESKLNCEVLHSEKSFEVRWAIAGDSVVIQLLAKLDDNEYMSFGLSPDPQRSEMIGADVAVAWLDKVTGEGHAVDYYLADKSQCSGKRGSCPDERITANSDSIRRLNAALVNGFSIVTYQRPLRASDKLDLAIWRNDSQAIVWAIGPLNERQEVSFHTHFNRQTQLLNFGRKPVWNCQLPDGNVSMRPDDDDDDDGYEANTDEDDDRLVDEAAADEEDDRAPPVYQGRPQQSEYRPTDNRRQEVIRRQPPADSVRPDDAPNNRRRQPQPPTAHPGISNRNDAIRPNDQPQPQSLQSQRRPTATVNAVVPAPRPAPRTGAWEIPPIQCYEPEDGVFYAQMGPTGGKQGYPAITGHVGWGISWYINGLLIPEINVVRGRTYTFVVESGNDPEVPAKYHPFYITDDPVGGYEYKSDDEKAQVRIFAGVHRSRSTGQVTPVGTGRLCNWTPDLDGPLADEYSSFGAYQRSLTLRCDEGEAGIIVWRPDEQTPDTVYYQCFTHRHLGWRIRVHDRCDESTGGLSGQASDVQAVYARPEADEAIGVLEDSAEGLRPDASIRYETKVRPNENFLLQHEKDLRIKNHNMNEVPPKIKFDVNKSVEISKLISDGIRAAEALEESIARPSANRSVPVLGASLSDQSERIEFKVVSGPKVQPQSTKKTPGVPQTVIDTSALAEYLRPPGVQNGPLFRPLKVAGRPRPPPQSSANEHRRPPNKGSSQQQQQHHRQSALPQPSIIVNHYKKPVPVLMRPFVGKPKAPIKSLASVLLLGQSSPEMMMLGPHRNKHFDGPPKANGEHAAPPFLLGNKPSGKPNMAAQTLKHNGGPYKNNAHREYYAPKFAHQSALKNGEPNGERPGSVSLRKKPQQSSNREPHLPLKGIRTSVFKSPYEISGPQIAAEADERGSANGFQPDSLIVEGGFKPIVRRRTDDDGDEIMLTSNRRSDDMVMMDDEAEDEVMGGDALFVNQRDIPTALFEPMFIPSPPDSSRKKLLARPTGEHLSGDLRDMEVEDGDDKIGMAGERIDSYYLPPDMPRTPPHSNFFPDGSVVTFDGKAVLDTSLVNSLPLPPVRMYANNDALIAAGGGVPLPPLTKTEQLIRDVPQFGPFRGEIPPIGMEFAPPPGLPPHFRTGAADEPAGPTKQRGTHPVEQRPVTEYTNPLTNSTNPISTRLVLLNPARVPKRDDGDDQRRSEAEDESDNEAIVDEEISDEKVVQEPVKRTMRPKGVVL